MHVLTCMIVEEKSVVNIKLNQQITVPIVLGIILIVTDYMFSWLSFILGPIPMLFVVSILIGVLTRDVEVAVITTIVSMAIGVGVCALITPFMFGIAVTSLDEVMILLFYTAVYTSRGPIFFFTGLPVLSEAILLYVLVAPLQYFIAPGFSAIGAKIGERFRNDSVENDDELRTEAPLTIEQ